MNTELREVYVETLQELIEQHSDVMVLEADLMETIGTRKLTQTHPENFVQCGIAEANMVGVAAGLSAIGKVPFMHSFGCFATRRCYDQLFVSGGYAKRHINIFGSDAGVSAVTNGGTHMPFEDIGLIRLIPHSRVIDVSDKHTLKAALKYAYHNPGINYIRSTRKALPELYQSENDIKIGVGNVLREGSDLVIVATGMLVHEAIAASDKISELTNKSVAVIDMHTIKPLDTSLLIHYAKLTQRVVTLENHNIIGGLGDAVASALLESSIETQYFKKLGVQEQYGQVGSLDYLKKVYGISEDKVIEACLAGLTP
ncbi:transketolase C-terminal domain-containing protein [Vibrio sp. SA48]|uniref:transketolase family protein n=1 Tax=Vibrio sp. S12_S33 TaxID=2720223 RepID=UPI001785EC0D|nr:transketolase C-terminal domain-containing protein [Vibrio sp. S12_S33]MBD1567298.1 transketolase family protein [Vibrio sp. S12_S33]